ncbi:MAG: hypothetical protein EZS28_017983 [Streblomastix strix]|uniref:Uncharacterized protein n=1 Tax=Streblomastix strix TaxID=222440 RepID=A0A5J4VVE3_9EUKA|nr:MAG: hypothetical protein EZS28_017983 [Streblomastix strix]
MSSQSVESFNIDYTEQLGFNAVAAQNLMPGDVVISEQPFSYAISSEREVSSTFVYWTLGAYGPSSQQTVK